MIKPMNLDFPNSEVGALLTAVLYLTSLFMTVMFPYLQELAFLTTILVGAGTLFLNLDNYVTRVKKGWIYKKIKKFYENRKNKS